MPADNIFVLDAQNHFIPMVATDYDAEVILQKLLWEHPESLPILRPILLKSSSSPLGSTAHLPQRKSAWRCSRG